LGFCVISVVVTTDFSIITNLISTGIITLITVGALFLSAPSI